MTSALLDPYRERESAVHGADPRVKLVLALATILAANATPVRAWPVHLAYYVLLGAVALWARLSLRHVAARSALALPFVLMAAAGLPFVREGEPLMSMNLLGLPVTVTDVGLNRFTTILVRSWLSVLVTVTLVVTTRFAEIVRAMRSLGVPLVLTSIMALMYRYLYILVEEARRLMLARDARSAEPAAQDARHGRVGRGLGWQAQVTGHMIGTLFLRTYERSERVYCAMLARGFTGEIRVLREERPSRGQMVVAAAALAALMLAVAAANLQGMGG